VATDYVPERRDIIWLDFEPTRGKEIGKYRPTLVLSSAEYNRATGLLICCPISTSIRDSVTEVKVRGLEKPSVVVANKVHTMAWQTRGARKIRKARKAEFIAVLHRLLPLLGAEEIL
jgi:mRNA interferase MazF